MNNQISLQSDVNNRDLRCVISGQPSHTELEDTFAAVIQMLAEGDSDSLDLLLDISPHAHRPGRKQAGTGGV